MKTKKFEGKLVLSKKTIANLNHAEMTDIHGGLLYTVPPDICLMDDTMYAKCTAIATNCLIFCRMEKL